MSPQEWQTCTSLMLFLEQKQTRQTGKLLRHLSVLSTKCTEVQPNTVNATCDDLRKVLSFPSYMSVK